LAGFGMDAARSLPGGREKPDAARLDRLGITGAQRAFFDAAPRTIVELIPLHTHSMPLQIRLELGFVGLALFAGFAFFGGRAAAALPGRGAFAAGAAVAGAAAVVSLLSYGAWQHWWWVSLALAALPLAVLSARGGR
jgi:thiamine transporter ThiT